MICSLLMEMLVHRILTRLETLMLEVIVGGILVIVGMLIGSGITLTAITKEKK